MITEPLGVYPNGDNVELQKTGTVINKKFSKFSMVAKVVGSPINYLRIEIYNPTNLTTSISSYTKTNFILYNNEELNIEDFELSTTLSENTNYYFKIILSDDEGIDTYTSSFYSFTTFTNPKAEIISPLNNATITDIIHKFKGKYTQYNNKSFLKYYQFIFYDNNDNIIIESEKTYSENIEYTLKNLYSGEYKALLKVITQDNLEIKSSLLTFSIEIPTNKIDYKPKIINNDKNNYSVINWGDIDSFKGVYSGTKEEIEYYKNIYNEENTVKIINDENITYNSEYIASNESTILLGINTKNNDFKIGDLIIIKLNDNNEIKVILDEDYCIKLKINDNIINNGNKIILYDDGIKSAFQTGVKEDAIYTIGIEENEQWSTASNVNLYTSTIDKNTYIKIALIPSIIISSNGASGFYIYKMYEE